MYRFFAATLVLAVGLVVASADDKKDEKKIDKPQGATEIFQELVQKFRTVKGKEDRDDLFKTYNAKLLAYAEKHKNEKGAEALFMVFQLPSGMGKDSPKAKANAALKKDHAKTTKFGTKIKQLRVQPDDQESLDLLKEIAETNKDKKTRAYAYKSLIKSSERAAQIGKRLKADEDFKANAEKQAGKGAIKAIMALAESSGKDIKGYKAKLEGDLKGILLDISEGKPAPEVVSQDPEGKMVKLSDLKGKVVVLDFWATWCGPCKAMIPHTKELVKKLEGKPFVFVSVSADDKKETLQDFLKKTSMPWTHWWAGVSGGVIEDWDIEAFPTIFVIDAKGVIRKKFIGSQDEDALHKEVEKLVKEAEGDKKTE